MKIYRVAILGCRARGTAAARAYHAHPRTEVVALCDLIPERAEALGEELGVAARYTDLDRMMEEVCPDLVAIPTGTEFHYDLAMRVLEYGAHIDLEKPMCVDLEQADALLAKAKEKGARIAVHHQGRVGGYMQAVARAVEEGRIGEVMYLHGSGKGYYGGYGLLNIGTHMINNMLRFGGRCRRVTAVAQVGREQITPDDVRMAPGGMGTLAGEDITAILVFENGLGATLWEHRFPVVDSTAYALQIYGSQGRLFWKTGGAWWLPSPHHAPDGQHDHWQPLAPIHPESYRPQAGADEADYWFAEEFVRALDEGRDHQCNGAEAHHVMEIMMGIFESAAYRREVDLPQPRRDHPLLRWRHESGRGEPPAAPRDYSQWLAEEDRRLQRV